MVGDLSAAIDLLNGNVTYTGLIVAGQVFRATRLTNGVNRRVLQQPEFIRGVSLARACELLHGLERAAIGHQSEFAHNQAHQSTILTMG